jgi:hypothetical protein
MNMFEYTEIYAAILYIHMTVHTFPLTTFLQNYKSKVAELKDIYLLI